MGIVINYNPGCGPASGNIGNGGGCNFDIGLIVGAMPVPKGTVLTAAQVADLRATLQAMLVNDTYASRAFRMGRFLEIDDQSEERQQKTWGYGKKTTTRGETYDWVFYYTDGGLCMHKNMMNFAPNAANYDYFFYDDNRNLIGTSGVDANGVQGFAGVSIDELYVAPWKPANGSDPAMYMVNFKISDTTQLNESLAVIQQIPFDLFSLSVVNNVELLVPSGSTIIVDADGDIPIGIQGGCGGQNLVERYGATIANVARFAAKNQLTGAAITITGVTITGVGASQYLLFNLDHEDTDYPSAGEYITINMVSVSTLNTAGLGYIESNVLTLEVS